MKKNHNNMALCRLRVPVCVQSIQAEAAEWRPPQLVLQLASSAQLAKSVHPDKYNDHTSFLVEPEFGMDTVSFI